MIFSMGTVANPFGRATLCFRLSVLNIHEHTYTYLNTYRSRTQHRKTNSSSLAQQRVTSKVLFQKIGADRADTVPTFCYQCFANTWRKRSGGGAGGAAGARRRGRADPRRAGRAAPRKREGGASRQNLGTFCHLSELNILKICVKFCKHSESGPQFRNTKLTPAKVSSEDSVV